jgi:mRNA interferase MazF
VIVQTDALLGLSTAIIAPTSSRAAPATFRPEIKLAGQRTRVLVEQLRAVDLQRLDEFAGCLTTVEQPAVDDALALILETLSARPDLSRGGGRVRQHRLPDGRQIQKKIGPA